MPADFLLDTEFRIVRSRCWGYVTVHDILDYIARIQQLYDQGKLDKDWSQIIDFREAERLEDFTQSDIQTLLESNPWAPETRRAMIMGNEQTFSLASSYQSMAGTSAGVIKVVYTDTDAEAWVREMSGHSA